MTTSKESSAKRIVNISGENGITANEDFLGELFLVPHLKDKPVCVISIAGTFRQGKSFVLNFLIRYLKLKYKLKRNISGKWLNVEDGNISGFEWKCGSDRHTMGILAWSDIFLAELSTGEEIAIVLLDTQGTFDNRTSRQHCAAMFAISTLISSVMIFNLKEKITQYDLEHLECFSGYGQLALDDSSHWNGSPFQNLCFLIRDWSCPHEHNYGLEGGHEFLRKLMNMTQTIPELQKQRDNIINIFDNIFCCLLPHPGQIVATSPHFQGELHEIDPTFLQCVEEFLPSILSPEKLVPKTINGQAIKLGDLAQFIKMYCQYFSTGTVPPLPTLYLATSEAQLRIAISESTQIYQEAMNVFLNSENALKTEVLEEHHLEQRKRVIEIFDNKKILGNTNIKSKFRKLLKGTLAQKYIEYRRINRIKQETEEKLDAQKKMFKKTQYEKREKLQKQYEQEMQNKLEELKNLLSDLESQVQDERNKLIEERHKNEIEQLRQREVHQEELHKKEKLVQTEKLKRVEERVVHQRELYEEQLQRQAVEMEAKENSKLYEMEEQYMKRYKEKLKKDKEHLEQDKAELVNSVDQVTKKAEEAQRMAEEAKRKAEEQGCIIL